jgi:murein DD-endopeptidase MepM/ murein hydrolase activator NlpD
MTEENLDIPHGIGRRTLFVGTAGFLSAAMLGDVAGLGFLPPSAFAASEYTYPLTTRLVTCNFACHINRSSVNPGTDFDAELGQDVMAVKGGTVSHINDVGLGTGGKMVYVNHNKGVQTQYLHLSTIAAGLNVGDTVAQGQRLGGAGSTGSSSAEHLHIAMKIDGINVDFELYVGDGPPQLEEMDKMAILRKKASTGTYVLLAEYYWYYVPSSSNNTYSAHFTGGQTPSDISDARLAVLVDAIDARRNDLVAQIAAAVAANPAPTPPA